MREIRSIASRTDHKAEFYLCLARDLRSIGIKARIQAQEQRTRLEFSLPYFSQAEVLRLMKIVRYRQLDAAASFIHRMEKNRVLDLFINGGKLKIEKISPRIHICNTPTDFEIYNYCRFLQSVPSTHRIGRQIISLVYDDGQDGSVLMGAIGLASSIYSVRCRDRYLGWIDKKAKALKNAGLKRIMDLAVCIAFPPYSFLLGGKLIALLAFTDPFRVVFQEKYETSLLALVTTCATGIHCPIFNRIMIVKGGLYNRIGETAGYTTVIFSTNTMRAARILIKGLDRTHNEGLACWPKPIRILRQAMRLCGIPPEPLLRLGNPKGVYIAVLSEDSLNCLKTGSYHKSKDYLSVKDAFEYWKTHILSKRILCPDTIKKIGGFSNKKLALSRILH